MSCSDLTDSDVETLKRFHAEQKWPYDFPDLDEQQFVVKRALHDDDGALVGGVVARKSVELYFLGDATWRTPRWRLEALKLMHEDMRVDLAKQEYTDGHCWLPPQVSKSFGKRLKKTFGWRKSTWDVYSRKVN